MKLIGEPLYLLFLAIKLFFFNLQEEKKVRRLFYLNASFKGADLALKKSYRGKNPYKICQTFHATYGETPLSILYKLLELCDLKKKDIFLDLGSGRGRSVLLASALFGCQAKGVDFVPFFCETAQKIGSHLPSPPQFFTQPLLSFPLKEETVIYFYALCLEESTLLKMIEKLSKTPSGTKIITVSFPLCDYSKDFSTLHSLAASYPFGQTTAFVNKKN